MPHKSDAEWEKWGARDPYFGVVTLEKFRAPSLSEEVLEEFFATGELHAEHVLNASRTFFGSDYLPRSVLDFGCGVGRVLIPLARGMDRALGVDVSPSMLQLARTHCNSRGAAHAELALSDDTLSQVQGSFDLVHSAIVFQHIEVHRGRELFRQLLRRVSAAGSAVIQVTYGKAFHPETYGQPPPPRPPPPQRPRRFGPLSAFAAALRKPESIQSPPTAPVSQDPEMHMYPYNLSELAFLLQLEGFRSWHAEVSDHGGEWGVTIFARRPQPTRREEPAIEPQV